MVKGWEQSRLLEAFDEQKGHLYAKLAEEKNANGTLWVNTRAVGLGGVAVPARLERAKISRMVQNEEGENVVVVTEEELPEPKESEQDIAEMEEERVRCEAAAEKVIIFSYMCVCLCFGFANCLCAVV